MQTTKTIMGMPVTIQVPTGGASRLAIDQVIAHLRWVDRTFSTYKPSSQISRINKGTLAIGDASPEVKLVLQECQRWKEFSHGFFDVNHNGHIDPSGYVKGWAIQGASLILKGHGINSYMVDVAGDIQLAGSGPSGPWRVGIKNPLEPGKLAKVVYLTDKAIATSGTYERGLHIYNPRTGRPVSEIISLTVIGDQIVDVDASATTAFSMGRPGLAWLRDRGLDAMLIDAQGIVTLTKGFPRYEHS